MHNYDTNNLFAKIIRGELPASKIYEDDKVLAFYDIYPIAPIHALVIPKGNYVNFIDFIENAPKELITHFFEKVAYVAKALDTKENFRILTNTGKESGQTIFHYHVHILSGAKLK